MFDAVGRFVASLAIGLATALTIVALVILPFLTPAWVGFEQDRANSLGWTGYTPAELGTATDAILHDLVLGPPAFEVAVRGVPVLDARERSHMRDVRVVFGGFYLVAGVATIGLGVTLLARRRSATVWRAVTAGAVGLAAATVAAGVVAAVAFDAAFEAFHRLFFASGTYDFDPRTERLVQLFPDAFWSETSLVLGVVIMAAAIGTAWAAGRRWRQLARPSSGQPRLAITSAERAR